MEIPDLTKRDPVTFVLFGVTGDLSQKKIIPALYELYSEKLLPAQFTLVGFGRREFTHEQFADFVRIAVRAKKDTLKLDRLEEFIGHVVYHHGFLDTINGYRSLIEVLKGIDLKYGACSHKIFHLSLSPHFYEIVLQNMHVSGLHVSCVDGPGMTRVLIEKPVGSDGESAKKINTLLLEIFTEKQIFRVDHYLMKHALWSLLSLRCHIEDLNNVWNNEHIDRVEMRLYEKQDVEGRGLFYDQVGTLRDVGQNHLMEMLALFADDRNCGLSNQESRANVLKNAMICKSTDSLAHGQYAGYTKENGVSSESRTETYFSLPLTLTSGSLADVCFTLESGKAMPYSAVEVEIIFKKSITIPVLTSHIPKEFDRIIMRIQPNIAVSLYKGTNLVQTVENTMEFVDTAFGPENYARVYLDALHGDQSRFVSRAEVETSWKVIDEVRHEFDKVPLVAYEKGTKPAR